VRTLPGPQRPRHLTRCGESLTASRVRERVRKRQQEASPESPRHRLLGQVCRDGAPPCCRGALSAPLASLARGSLSVQSFRGAAMSRTERIDLRITLAEKIVWAAAAVRAGLSLSQYIRVRVNAVITGLTEELVVPVAAPAERPSVSAAS